MDIGRKDFFRKSLFSLGEALCTVSSALKSPPDPDMAVPDTADFEPSPHEELASVAQNDTCLARNSGCFACLERCEQSAIKLIPGVGVRINPQFCIGCGTCEYVCPVTPKAIRMQASSTIQTSPGDHAVPISPKGESPC